MPVYRREAAKLVAAQASSVPERQRQGPLQLQKPLLERQSAAVPDQFPAGTDHPMARHHDRDRVGPVGRSHGAHSPRRPDRLRALQVAPRLPVRDALQFAPYAALEVGALHIQREVETPQLPCEIGPQLARCLGGDGVNPVPAALDRARKIEINGPQPAITCNQPHSQTIYKGSFGTLEHAVSLSQEAVGWRPLLFRQRPRSCTCYNWTFPSICSLSLSHPITERRRRSSCSSPVVFAPVSSRLSMWSRSL